MEKNMSQEPFKKVLSQVGFKPLDAIFIDDSHANHKHANAMGIQTVHINYGNKIECDTISHAFETAENFLSAYNKKQELLKNYPPKNDRFNMDIS